jgi:membrane-associated HD superfamily phosphohydrolase
VLETFLLYPLAAPNYIEVIDEEQTALNKALAVDSVNPIYSIDTTINDAVINGVKDMFLAVIEARISETLIVNDSDIVTENTEPEVKIKNLTKLEQIEKITESLLFSTISTSTIEVLVEISNYDLNNKSNYLAQLELEAKSQANDILNNGINNENLNGLRQSIVSNPPYLDLTSDLFLLIPENRLRSTVSEIIAENLVSNQKLEEDLWITKNNRFQIL